MSDLASMCIRLAVWLTRKQDSEWAQAMRAELQYMPARNRLNWAIGCVISVIQRRIDVMRLGNFQVSRGLLLLELLLCFAPITLGWWDAVFGRSGVLQLNQVILDEFFLRSTLGTSVLVMMIGGAVIGLVGPIGLFLTSRAVITGAGLRHRSWGTAMIAGVACYAIASTVLRLLAGPGAYAATPGFVFLICVLPAVGIVHLMYLARQSNAPAAAKVIQGV